MEKHFLPQKSGKWAENHQKEGFFEFKEKFKNVFILYWKFLFAVFLYKPFGKILVPVI